MVAYIPRNANPHDTASVESDPVADALIQWAEDALPADLAEQKAQVLDSASPAFADFMSDAARTAFLSSLTWSTAIDLGCGAIREASADFGTISDAHFVELLTAGTLMRIGQGFALRKRKYPEADKIVDHCLAVAKLLVATEPEATAIVNQLARMCHFLLQQTTAPAPWTDSEFKEAIQSDFWLAGPIMYSVASHVPENVVASLTEYLEAVVTCKVTIDELRDWQSSFRRSIPTSIRSDVVDRFRGTKLSSDEIASYVPACAATLRCQKMLAEGMAALEELTMTPVVAAVDSLLGEAGISGAYLAIGRSLLA